MAVYCYITYHTVDLAEALRQLLVDGCKLFAVTTPRGIHLLKRGRGGEGKQIRVGIRI